MEPILRNVLSGKIEELLVPLIVNKSDHICIIDPPGHPNVGDSAILLGELSFLKRKFPGAKLSFYDVQSYSPKAIYLPGPAISGEIDEFSYPALVSALEGFAGEPGDIYAHLAGLAFCGLVGLTRVSLPGHGARRVVLHGVPPHLKAVPRILGWAWSCTSGTAASRRDLAA